jgi:ABC-type antimicrobial peptide transport system permease subunit
MLKRLKTALVDSFVGAIALGYLFAQGILHFVGIFIEPVRHWIAERELWELTLSKSALPAFPFKLVLSELLTSVFLLLIAYGLLRWLYYPATEKQDQGQPPKPEEGV